ncbi:hypothetical protein [Shewanella colwelliana]|uniref:hypothetical protein n=1 Tax=Shewanella colwelliana TaxID=23 RepID=UPI00048DECCE|nr:hypothetical protein [Shewanella colwelliana]
MEYIFKVLLYALCKYEKSKGGSNMYSLGASLSTLSFFILLNIHSALLLAEVFFSGVFLKVNDWIYHENHFVLITVACYLIPFVWFLLRRTKYDDFMTFEQEMEASLLVKRFGIYNVIVYMAISALTFMVIFFSKI